MIRPLLLDLFCGGGGAAMGYHRAGFDVIGVDHKPQPDYPFPIMVGDVIECFADWWGRIIGRAVAVHASPPCQFASAYRRRPGVAEDAENLIPKTRRLLECTGLPYVIENVDQKPVRQELRDPIRLCGSMFDGLDVQRHRLFETNWPIGDPPPCRHNRPEWKPRFPSASNRNNLRKTVEVGVWRIDIETQQKAMGIDWLKNPTLSQAIPPAYTEWIGRQLLEQVAS